MIEDLEEEEEERELCSNCEVDITGLYSSCDDCGAMICQDCIDGDGDGSVLCPHCAQGVRDEKDYWRDR